MKVKPEGDYSCCFMKPLVTMVLLFHMVVIGHQVLRDKEWKKVAVMRGAEYTWPGRKCWENVMFYKCC